MEIIAVVIFVVGALLWLLHGAYNNRVRKADEEARALHEAYKANRDADTDYNDELDRRVREKYKNR